MLSVAGVPGEPAMLLVREQGREREQDQLELQLPAEVQHAQPRGTVKHVKDRVVEETA